MSIVHDENVSAAALPLLFQIIPDVTRILLTRDAARTFNECQCGDMILHIKDSSLIEIIFISIYYNFTREINSSVK